VSTAPPLRAFVIARRRRWLAARGVECTLAAGAALALTLAAARLSGAPLGAPAVAAASLCALLAGASLFGELRVSPLEFARGFDARLGAQGELATAFQWEARARSEPLAALLVARTLAGIDRARLARASSPPSPLFGAALLFALALLAWVGELAPADPGDNAQAALVRLEALAAGSAANGPEELATLLEDLEPLRSVAGGAAAGERALELRVQRALEILAERSGADATSSGAGAAESRMGRVARAALEGGAWAGAAGEPSRSEPGGSAARPTSGDPALAAEPSVRTMSPPPSTDPMPSTSTHDPAAPPSSSASGSSELSAVSPLGHFWPGRHDAVVAAYLAGAAPRSAAEDSAGH
jgi:hypothetical protein